MATQAATDIERTVINWLVKNHITDFQFQSSLLGGFYELGGAVVDVLFPARALAWRIHGDYWHSGVEKSARDAVQRELLESRGWTVIDIWGSDLDNPVRRDEVLSKALRGEEVLR